MCKHQNIRDNQKNENLDRNNANIKFSFLVTCTVHEVYMILSWNTAILS